MTKASIASISVIQRCFQIVPSTNHLTMRAATSTGVEKKNGGSSVRAADRDRGQHDARRAA